MRYGLSLPYKFDILGGSEWQTSNEKGVSMTDFETGTEVVLGRREGRVAVLTFNRPEARNALHPETYEAFERLLPEIAEDSEVGALMLTGAGGAFCAGGDVKGMNARNSGAAADCVCCAAELSEGNGCCDRWSGSGCRIIDCLSL